MNIKKIIAFTLSCALMVSQLGSHYTFARNNDEPLVNIDSVSKKLTAKRLDTGTEKSKDIQAELDYKLPDLKLNNFESLQFEIENENISLKEDLKKLKELVDEIKTGKVENAQKKQKYAELAKQVQSIKETQEKNTEKNSNNVQEVNVLSKVKNIITSIIIYSTFSAAVCFLGTLFLRIFDLTLDLLLKPFLSAKQK